MLATLLINSEYPKLSSLSPRHPAQQPPRHAEGRGAWLKCSDAPCGHQAGGHQTYEHHAGGQPVGIRLVDIRPMNIRPLDIRLSIFTNASHNSWIRPMNIRPTDIMLVDNLWTSGLWVSGWWTTYGHQAQGVLRKVSGRELSSLPKQLKVEWHASCFRCQRQLS